jgi:hypothetical protein
VEHEQHGQNLNERAADIMLVPAHCGDVGNHNVLDAVAKALLMAGINEPETDAQIRLVRLAAARDGDDRDSLWARSGTAGAV